MWTPETYLSQTQHVGNGRLPSKVCSRKKAIVSNKRYLIPHSINRIKGYALATSLHGTYMESDQATPMRVSDLPYARATILNPFNNVSMIEVAEVEVVVVIVVVVSRSSSNSRGSRTSSSSNNCAHIQNRKKTKHNSTVCIFDGTYCSINQFLA